MALSYVTYSATQDQKVFSIPFSFLSSAYVKLRINEVDESNYTISGTNLTIADVVEVNSGDFIYIYRETPEEDDERIVVFTGGSTIEAGDLNTALLQVLHLAQENLDALANALQKDRDGSGEWDAESTRIKNLASPSVNSDAARLQDVQDQAFSAGNVPSLGAGQEDYFFAEDSGTGTWVDPETARTKLNLSDVPDRLVDLEAGGAACELSMAEEAVAASWDSGTYSSWYEDPITKVTPGTLTTINNESNWFLKNDAQKSLQLRPGKYMIEVRGGIRAITSPVSGDTFKFAATNKDGSVVYKASGEWPVIVEPGVYHVMPFSTRFIVDVTVTTDICLRLLRTGIGGMNTISLTQITATKYRA